MMRAPVLCLTLCLWGCAALNAEKDASTTPASANCPPDNAGGEPNPQDACQVQGNINEPQLYRTENLLIETQIAFICPDAVDHGAAIGLPTKERCLEYMNALYESYKRRRAWCNLVLQNSPNDSCPLHLAFLKCQATNAPWKPNMCDDAGAAFSAAYPDDKVDKTRERAPEYNNATEYFP